MRETHGMTHGFGALITWRIGGVARAQYRGWSRSSRPQGCSRACCGGCGLTQGEPAPASTSASSPWLAKSPHRLRHERVRLVCSARPRSARQITE
jgi:hypothetical protein